MRIAVLVERRKLAGLDRDRFAIVVVLQLPPDSLNRGAVTIEVLICAVDAKIDPSASEIDARRRLSCFRRILRVYRCSGPVADVPPGVTLGMS